MARHYDYGPSIPELIRRLERRVEALEKLVHSRDGRDAAGVEVNRQVQEAPSESDEQGWLDALALPLEKACRENLARVRQMIKTLRFWSPGSGAFLAGVGYTATLLWLLG